MRESFMGAPTNTADPEWPQPTLVSERSEEGSRSIVTVSPTGGGVYETSVRTIDAILGGIK